MEYNNENLYSIFFTHLEKKLNYFNFFEISFINKLYTQL